MYLHFLKERTGFTLVEITIYIAVLAIIIVSLSALTVEIIKIKTAAASQREVQENLRFISEKITQLIESSSFIESPLPGESSNSLILQTPYSYLNPTILSLSGVNIKASQGTTGPIKLNSDLVKVTRLSLANTSSLGGPGSIRVEIQLQTINPSQRPEYGASSSLVVTQALREKDSDGDVFSDGKEFFMGTNPLKACPDDSIPNNEDPDPWPPDFNDDGVVNILDTFDWGAFGSKEGDVNYSPRYDFYPDGVINILDISTFSQYYGASCTNP